MGAGQAAGGEEFVGAVVGPLGEQLAQDGRARDDPAGLGVLVLRPGRRDGGLEQRPQPGVGGDGGEVAAAGAAELHPRRQVEGEGVGRPGDGHPLGQQDVQQVEFGGAAAAVVGEQVDGDAVGAQPLGHPPGEFDGGGAGGAAAPAAPEVGGPAPQPGGGRLGAVGARAGEEPLGAALGEDGEPGAVRGALVLGAGRARQDLQQPGADGLVAPGELDQRAVPGLPERARGATDGG